MVTLNGHGADYRALSTDTKPTEAEVNALLLEVDTLNFYYFDGTEWQAAGGGTE